MDRLTSLTAFVRTVELGSQAAAAAELTSAPLKTLSGPTAS